MRSFKFLRNIDTNEMLLDFTIYLCNFCNWSDGTIQHDATLHHTDWGSFWKTDYTWQDNDTTTLTFRYHQIDGNIYTIKVQKDYNWHTHEFTDYYVPDRGIRHNNPN